MDSLDTGKDKIKKICDVLKREALDPAREEAEKHLQEARESAASLIEEAKRKADAIVLEGYQKIEAQKRVFEHALKQACAQSVENLKQTIEAELFNHSITPQLEKFTSDPKLMAPLAGALIEAIKRDGAAVNIELVIGKSLNKETFIKSMGKAALEKIEGKEPCYLEGLEGFQLKFKDRKFTLDFSVESLKESIGHYLRRDFKELLFGEA